MVGVGGWALMLKYPTVMDARRPKTQTISVIVIISGRDHVHVCDYDGDGHV